MLSAKPLVYAPGTVLLVRAGESIVYSVRDFVDVSGGMDNKWKVTFDFGYGTHCEVNWDDPSTTVTWTYSHVATYTLRLLVELGDPVTTRRRFAWRVQVGSPADDFYPGGSQAYIAAVHATFNLPFGQRELVMPLPKCSFIGSSGEMPTSSDNGTQSGPADAAVLQAGLAALCRSLQQAFAYGFGRLPVHSATQSAIHAHLQFDSLVYGTSTALEADLASVEYQWGEALRHPERVDAMDLVRATVEDIGALYPDLSELGRANLCGGNILVPGPHTINLKDVEAWHAYATGAIDDNLSLGETTVRDWSTHQGNFDRNVPEVDWGTVWRREIMQVALECVGAMYEKMSVTSIDDANIVVTVDPLTRACSLRMFDSKRCFWAHASVAPIGADGHIELSDMDSDGAQVAQADGAYVAARAAGMADLTMTAVPHLFDLRFVQTAFDGTAFAKVPTVATLAAGINIYGENPGIAVQRTSAPDGASTVSAENERVAVATMAAPAMAMPDGKDAWSSLRPHALLAVLSGKMAPVQRRG